MPRAFDEMAGKRRPGVTNLSIVVILDYLLAFMSLALCTAASGLATEYFAGRPQPLG